MPSPEQLGVTCARPDAADWPEARKRLRELGAVSFQLDELPEGGCRFVCLLRTDRPDRTHRVEARAGDEGGAVRSVLERAELWARQQK